VKETAVMLTRQQQRCRKKFLRFFPGGFKDEKYYAWERGYKWEAHLAWKEQLDRKTYEMLLAKKKYAEIAHRAVKLETKTNLLFSFEKMALRDAVRPPAGAKAFALGLFEFVYGKAIGTGSNILPKRSPRFPAGRRACSPGRCKPCSAFSPCRKNIFS
jgi:hypothetical protein